VPRVVITGIGVISAIGLTRDAFWRSLVAGTCGIHNVNSSDFEQLRFKHAADVEGFVAALTKVIARMQATRRGALARNAEAPALE